MNADRNRVPRVSIGLPVYNNVTLVDESLDCLLSQTYSDFELVISDNASTDGTSELCREYAARDPRIRYARQEVNRGSVWNFNEVFRMARGEYFKWAAADDLCRPEFLQACVEVLDANPEVAWCFTRSNHIDSQGRPLPGRKGQELSFAEPEPPGSPAGRCTRADACPSDRFRAVILGTTGCQDTYGLMRSEVIRQTPLYLPYFGSEKVFMAEMALRGRYAEVPQLLFSGRIHEQAAGSLKSAKSQRAFINPLRRGRLEFTRLALLRGYLSAIHRAPLTFGQRARCLRVVARYLFQTHKWKKVLGRTYRGRGLAEDRPELESASASQD